LTDLQFLDVGQTFENRETTVLVDLADEVGRVVGLHAREQSRGVGVATSLEELDLVGGVQFFEDIGLEFTVGATASMISSPSS